MTPGGEELHQVVELAVDVAAHRHGAVDRLHVGLLDEDLLHLNGFITREHQSQPHTHSYA